jgi:hypothetical protein
MNYLKKSIIIFILVVQTICCAGDIDLSSGSYSDDFSTDVWMSDCFTYSSVSRVSGYLYIAGGGSIEYRFIKPNPGDSVTVQFDAFAFGDAAATQFALSSDGNYSYQSIVEYLGREPSGFETVQLSLSENQTHAYFSLINTTGGCYCDNLQVVVEGTRPSAEYIHEMPVEGFTDTKAFDDDSWQFTNYEIQGASTRDVLNNTIKLPNDGDSIRFAYKSERDLIVSDFTASFDAVINDGILQVGLYNFSYLLLSETQLTSSGAVILDTSGVTNKDGAIIEFSSIGGEVSFDNLSVTATMIAGIHASDGDYNRDRATDIGDLVHFSENWLSEGLSHLDLSDFSYLATNWLDGIQNLGFVDNIAGLKAIADPHNGDAVFCGGRTSFSDGGGGMFYWDTFNTMADDGTMVLSADSGTPGRWIRARSSSLVNIRLFGARGDGYSDDSAAINAACRYARDNKAVLYVPAGRYICRSPINMTRWGGLEIKGEGDGVSVLVAEGITNTAFDMSGSHRAKIMDIGFSYQGKPPLVTILLARGDVENGYGSAVFFRGCSINGGSLAGFYTHSGEIHEFRNCRFTTAPGGAGYMCTGGNYGVVSPFGFPFTPTPGHTQWSMTNCYYDVSDGGTGLFMDAQFGISPSQADLTIFGCTFELTGDDCSALKTTGGTTNFNILAGNCDVISGNNSALVKNMSGQGFFIQAGVKGGARLLDNCNPNLSFIMGSGDVDIVGGGSSSQFILSGDSTVSLGSNMSSTKFAFGGDQYSISVPSDNRSYSLTDPEAGSLENLLHRKYITTSNDGFALSNYAITREGLYSVSYGNEWYYLSAQQVSGSWQVDVFGASLTHQRLRKLEISGITYVYIYAATAEGAYFSVEKF